MDVEAPAVGADDPLNRHAPAVRAQTDSRPGRCASRRSSPCGRTAVRLRRGRAADRDRAETTACPPSHRLAALDDLCARSHLDGEVSRDFHLQAGGSTPGRSADRMMWPLRSHQGPVIKNGVAAGLQPALAGPSRRARQKHDAHRRTADCLRDDVEWAVVEGNQRPGAERRTFEQRATGQHVYRSVPRVTSAGTFCTMPFSCTSASMASSSIGRKSVKFSTPVSVTTTVSS